MNETLTIQATINGRPRTIEVEVNHRPRTRGKSKYGLGRIFKVLLDLITVWFLLVIPATYGIGVSAGLPLALLLASRKAAA